MASPEAKSIELLHVGSTIAVIELEHVVAAVLRRAGLSATDAQRAAVLLTYAQRSGLETHGILHLPFYVARLLNGTINANARLEFDTPEGAATALDANDALGCIAADAAMDEAMRRAASYGVGSVAVRNSSHFGPAGVYVQCAANAGYVGIAMSNASATMAPWGGREALLGTNPIAAAFPRNNGAPVVIDMATSAAARADVRKAAAGATTIPSHWALDEQGHPTTDAQAALAGSMQPMGGAKGAALSLMVELLCSCLAGGAAGVDVRVPQDTEPAPCKVSHFFLALHPDAFAGAAILKRSVDALSSAIERSPPSVLTQPVRVPGSAAAATREHSDQHGVKLTTALHEALHQASKLVDTASG